MDNNGFIVRTDWEDDRPAQNARPASTRPQSGETRPASTRPQNGETRPASVTPPEEKPDLTGQRSMEQLVYTADHPRSSRPRFGYFRRTAVWVTALIALIAVVCAVLLVPVFPVTYLADQQVYNENGTLCERVYYTPDGTVEKRFIHNDEGMNETVTYTYRDGLPVKEESLLFDEPYQQILYEYRNGFAERVTLLNASGNLLRQETATLDAVGPVSAVVQNAAGDVLAEKTYTYTNDQLTELSVFDPQAATLTVTAYRYENGRLAQEVTTVGEEVVKDVSYSYNADGLLQLQAQSGKETHRYTYLYEYQTVRRNLLARRAK